jgi:hypothetical protein
VKKFIVPVEPTRTIRMAPHRFGQVGNMLIIEDEDGDRLDLYLTDDQIASLGSAIAARLRANAESRAWIEEATA